MANLRTDTYEAGGLDERTRILEIVRGIELVEVEHQNWCDYLQDSSRCNCDKSDLYYLQQDIHALATRIEKDDL